MKSMSRKEDKDIEKYRETHRHTDSRTHTDTQTHGQTYENELGNT